MKLTFDPRPHPHPTRQPVVCWSCHVCEVRDAEVPDRSEGSSCRYSSSSSLLLLPLLHLFSPQTFLQARPLSCWLLPHTPEPSGCRPAAPPAPSSLFPARPATPAPRPNPTWLLPPSFIPFSGPRFPPLNPPPPPPPALGSFLRSPSASL